VDPHSVHMVCDTVRDLLAAQAAGCKPHLVKSGRAAALAPEQVQRMLTQVPGTRVHDDLAAFADWLLAAPEAVQAAHHAHA
jgi:D-glycero-D-manno-heptose 1,7-bisphosphate phosphatase